MNHIVIPEGLRRISGQAMEASLIYQGVLRELAMHLRKGDQVFLAPANHFGTAVSEQEAAARFLISIGVQERIVYFESRLGLLKKRRKQSSYVNTRGNAILLREYLKECGEWPLDSILLWVNAPHAARAAIIFRQEGFCFQLRQVRLPVLRDEIVERLWYYNYPWIHRIYEALALVLFRLGLL